MKLKRDLETMAKSTLKRFESQARYMIANDGDCPNTMCEHCFLQSAIDNGQCDAEYDKIIAREFLKAIKLKKFDDFMKVLDEK